MTKQVTEALETFRYADAARALYDFAWDEFCSFYVEMTKARFRRGRAPTSKSPRRCLAHALDTLLRLLHPMTPFLTEEVWQLLGEVAPVRGFEPAASPAVESVCVAAWPGVSEADSDASIEAQFASFQAVLGVVREVRQGQGIPWTETLEFAVKCDAETATLLEPMTPYFAQMAKATPTAMGPAATAPDVTVSKPAAGGEVHVDVSQFIDVDAEIKRLTKERDQKAKFVKGLEGKLANDKFVANAPAEVVEQERGKLADAQQAIAALDASLAKLSG